GLAWAQRGRGLQQQMRAGGLGRETGQQDEVGVVVDRYTQGLSRDGEFGVRALLHECDDATADKIAADARSGVDDRSRDRKPTDLRQLNTAHAGFGLVV